VNSLEDVAGTVAAEIHLSSWRQHGTISVPGGPEYRVRRRGALGPFVLEGPDDSELAHASKPSAFRREFILEHGGRHYTLKAGSAFQRDCTVYCDGTLVGRVSPPSWLSRRAMADIPDDVPIVIRAFMVWLTLLVWKRDSDADAIAATSA
jgi:hypothetical protein